MKKTILFTTLFLAFSSLLRAEEPITFSKLKSEKHEKYLNDIKLLKKSAYGDPQNCVKLKVIPLLFRMASIQYERALNEKMSVACDVNFLFLSVTAGEATTSFNAFGISPEFRFYPGEEALKGFFVGPYLSYLNMGVKVESSDVSTGRKSSGEISGINAFGAGALLGWKWIIADVFAIESHFGLNYLSLTIPDKVDVKYDDGTQGQESTGGFSGSGFLPTGGLSLGFAF